MRLSTYFRCQDCSERWLISHDLVSLLFNFWGVQAEKAAVELEYNNHRIDCILAKLEEPEKYLIKPEEYHDQSV